MCALLCTVPPHHRSSLQFWRPQAKRRRARAKQLAEGLRRRLQHDQDKLAAVRTSIAQAREVVYDAVVGLEHLTQLQSSCRGPYSTCNTSFK